MGLDLVEIIMTVEERFGIAIPDEKASQVTTVGDLVDLVCERLDGAAQRCGNFDRGSAACPTTRAFYKFRKELLRILSLARHEVQPSASLEELIPPPLRRVTWIKLRLAGMRLPELRLTRSAMNAVLLAPLVPAVLLTIWAGACLGLLAYPIVLAMVFVAARPQRIVIPESCHSVGQAARLLAQHPVVTGQHLARPEVSEAIRQTIASQLQIPVKSIREDSRLTKDLGL